MLPPTPCTAVFLEPALIIFETVVAIPRLFFSISENVEVSIYFFPLFFAAITLPLAAEIDSWCLIELGPVPPPLPRTDTYSDE